MQKNNEVDSEWYKCIRPSITPPNYVFPIVWTTFYIFFFVFFAELLYVQKNALKDKIVIIIIFSLHFIVNVLWSFVYFYKKMIALSFFMCLFLLITGLILAEKTKKVFSKWNYIMWLIYSSWLLFATTLNFLSIFNVEKCHFTANSIGRSPEN